MHNPKGAYFVSFTALQTGFILVATPIATESLLSDELS
jgi:hypothetical protein